MKKLVYVIVALLTMVIVSCNKTQEITQPFNQQERASGILPDPPELKAKMQLQVSQEFALKGRTVSFVGGKRVADLSAVEANQLFQSAAKPSKGNWSGGNGTGGGNGGTTTGGGGTIVIGDVTAPRIMITSPEPGKMYDLQSTQFTRMSWIIAADDETDLRRIVVKIKGDVVKDTSGNLNTADWIVVQDIYSFPYGDGAYDMTAQAWDAKGNTTITSLVFYRNTQMTPLPTNFPSAYTMPHITTNQYISQGGEGSCAAFIVANAYSIDRYNKEGQTGGFNNNNVYSPEWIYNISLARAGYSNQCGAGSGILGNMSIVVNRGIPTWNFLPYSSQNGCDTSMFTDAIRSNASQNKAVWGYYVSTADRNLIKMKVAQNKPAMFTCQLDRQLTYWIPSNTIWTFPHYRDGGPHGMIIVGYDDNKKAYLVLNSWSSDWGNAGKVWIDYDFFEQEVTGACWYFG